MHARSLAAVSLLALAISGCGGTPQVAPEVAGPRNLAPVEVPEILPIEHVTYVPIYSSLHLADHVPPLDLGATLSLRNTSEREDVIVRAVEYYDSDGKLLRNLLDRPSSLGPQMTAEFFIARADRSGGSGANFLVRWGRRAPAPELLVQALMFGREGNAGVSFITQGTVIDEAPPARRQ